MVRLAFRMLMVAVSVASATAPLAAQSGRAVFELPITFASPSGVPSASPVVAVRIGGRQTAMVLDNNVTHEMFTARIARELALPVKGRIVGTRDHAGATIDADRLEDLSVVIDEHPIVLRHAGAFAMDSSFDREGLAGILPFDALLDTGYVLLAPSVGRLVVIPGTARTAQAVATRHAWRVAPVPTQRDAAGHLYIQVALADRPVTWAAVDIGGARTEATVDYARWRLTDSVCVSRGASGQCHWGAQRPNARLRVGAHTLRVDTLTIVRTAGGVASSVRDARMLLGMDLLRRCIVGVPIRQRGPVLFGCPSDASTSERTRRQ